jgi:lipid A disaccharide synthetase
LNLEVKIVGETTTIEYAMDHVRLSIARKFSFLLLSLTNIIVDREFTDRRVNMHCAT